MSKSIAVLGSDQVPLAYTVPVPGTLTPLAGAAVFDGSGAGAFLPALSFYDNDGNLIARATAPEVAAGATAEVSWFPGAGLGEGQATGPSSLPVFSVFQPNTFTWLPSTTTPRAISWPRFATSDPSFYFYDSGQGTVRIQQPGTYASFITVNPDADWPTSPTGPIKIGSWGGDTNEPFGIAPYGQHPAADVFAPPVGDTLDLSSYTVLGFQSAAIWNGGGMNFSGANFVGIDAQAWVWRIGDNVEP